MVEDDYLYLQCHRPELPTLNADIVTLSASGGQAGPKASGLEQLRARSHVLHNMLVFSTWK